MKKIIYICILLTGFGCSKNDTPNSPEAVVLLFPLENSECISGKDINQTTRIITFEWEESKYTDSYELTVENLLTNTSQVVSTSETSVELPITKGVPFRWSVISENDDVDITATSDVWKFYNAGAQTSYAPFPAEIVYPNSGESVFKDTNNEVTLLWEGSDVDSDIDSYEVYFSNTNPPTALVETTSDVTEEFNVSVSSETIYYWQIKTLDSEGNSSVSGVYSFRVY